MPNVIVRNVPDDVYRLLRRSAKLHRRTLNGEILSILDFEADLAQRGLELVRTFPQGASSRNSRGRKEAINSQRPSK